jgi:hypothetical protein
VLVGNVTRDTTLLIGVLRCSSAAWSVAISIALALTLAMSFEVKHA